ncbi:Bifunctional adenosylcobalamin biosynthesis protein CobU [subsurface metagenome]|nr:bifunctional adenosylcobinamide kinase/adenosylcobinamide-phosphate guanylyltransferase [Dehalococcoidia bacterium]
MAKSFILILGGVRSGKSGFAQSMAAKLGRKVLFVATGQPLDEEMASRIEEHKRMRPKNWRTLEIDVKVGQKLKGQIGDAEVVLLDCLALLVSNVIQNPSLPLSLRAERSNLLALRAGSMKNLEKIDSTEAEKLVMDEIDELIECINRHQGIFIVVSNEVGLGLVPENKLGRVYRDLLGKANQFLAQHADEVYFMASGIPVKIKG